MPTPPAGPQAGGQVSFLGAAVAAALLVAVAATGSLAPPAGAVETVPAAVGAGTVETIVGPGVCPGVGTVDPASTTVGALVVDAEGTIFADVGPPALSMVTRVDVGGTTTTLRTTGPGGAPGRLVSDGAGGLLVAATSHIDHHRAQGGIVPLAGDRLARGVTPSSGDGGPATQARFARVTSLASDEAGNVYVADAAGDEAGGVRIRFVNRTSEPVTLYPGTPAEVVVAPGHIDTIAGGGASTGSDGEGAAARAVLLQGGPPVMAVADGRLYLTSHHASPSQPGISGVRMVNLGGSEVAAHGVQVPAGAMKTVAGGGPAGFGGDRGPALAARLGRLPGIAADGAGNLYVADADHHRVRRIDSAGIISTFAGFGPVAQGGFNGNDRLASVARLDEPVAVAVAAGPGGPVYIADRGNGQVRVVDKQGIIYAAPGNGRQRAWACEEQGRTLPPGASRALKAGPIDAAVDGGDVYFPVGSSGSKPVVYRHDASGRVAPFVGGSRHLEPCPRCEVKPIALPGDAAFGRPVAVAVTRRGGLYVLDGADGRLWLANLGAKPLSAHGIAVAPGAVTSVADDAMGKAARGGSMAADDRGNVFIVDLDQVRRLDPQGKLTTLVQKMDVSRLNGVPLDRQVANSKCCAVPAGVAVDAAGNPYVSDALSGRVWYLNQTGQPVTVHAQTVAAGAWAVIAGSGERGFEGDGAAALDSKLQQPGRLAVDPAGSLYIVDPEEHTIRRVDPAGKISPVVGRGSPGFNGDGLAAGVTALSSPAAVAIDACGNLIIADTDNQRLRRWNAGRPCATPARADATESGGGRSSTLVALVGVGLLLSTVGTFGILRRRRRRRADAQPDGTLPEAVAPLSNSSANLQPDFIAMANPHCHTAIAGPTDTAAETAERTIDKEIQ